MKGIGIASFLIVTAVTLFYTTIIGISLYFKKNKIFYCLFIYLLAHAVFYLFSSFREVMPWSLCSHSWNTDSCSERMRVENYTSK
jgi:hypothetical protein